MKKLLLSLGTVAAIAAPVASVIACGSKGDTTTITTNKVVEDSILNSDATLKALGAQDASYIANNTHTTFDFTATKAGALDGEAIEKNARVAISFYANQKDFKINVGDGPKTISESKDVEKVIVIINKVIKLQGVENAKLKTDRAKDIAAVKASTKVTGKVQAAALLNIANAKTNAALTKVMGALTL